MDEETQSGYPSKVFSKGKGMLQKLSEEPKNNFHWLAKFFSICYKFIALMMQDRGENFHELKALVESELQYEKDWNRRSLAIKALFPAGHRSLHTQYAQYQNAKQFRTRMRRAGQLLYTLSQLDEFDIVGDYEAFNAHLENELKELVIERASRIAGRRSTKQGDVQRDIMSIPNAFNLKTIYQEQLEHRPKDS